MAAIVIQVVNDKIIPLRSYAIPDCSTRTMAQTIRADYPRRRLNAIIDMSGTQLNRDTTSPFGVTDRTILEEYGFTIVNNRKSNPLISDTDNSSNAFIAAGRLIVDPTDTKLLEALSTYHYEDGSRKRLVKYAEAKFMHIDGLGDCLRYGIHHLFPATGERGGDYRGGRPTKNTPGLEYAPKSPLFPGGPTMQELLSGGEEYDYRSY
jgi:hypothetical protein